MKRTSRLPLAVLLWTAALGAQAQALSNGSFADPLSVGWEVLGDASRQQALPADYELWLTTASTGQDDDPLPEGALNLSLTPAAAVAVPDGVENFVGLEIGALDPDPANFVQAYEGSAARQTFTAAAGDTLSFSWNYLTRDNLDDYAFVVVDGLLTRLAGYGDASLVGPGNYSNQTGVRSFSQTFATDGSHTVAFGVVDVTDFVATSALTVSNVQISPVPEGSALAMLVAGIGLLAGLTRARRG
jgi:hypothetical protein